MSTPGSKAAVEHDAGGFAQTRGSLEQHTEPSPAAVGDSEYRKRIP